MPLDFDNTSERQWAMIKGFSQAYIDSIPPTERDLESLSPAARKAVLERHYATRRAVESVYSAYGEDFDDDEEER